VNGYYWSRSDTFTVPPRTTRYEVWVIVAPWRSINALLEVYINGIRSLVDTLRLDPIHVY